MHKLDFTRIYAHGRFEVMKRYLETCIKEDLTEKMVFLGGPRQVGKTTLALNILGVKGPDHGGYLNWDVVANQRSLMQGELPANQKLVVLDEIHKYRKWRNLVKGFFDIEKSRRQFLITGSARLDYFRRGGDSLQGRYHYYRLHCSDDEFWFPPHGNEILLQH